MEILINFLLFMLILSVISFLVIVLACLVLILLNKYLDKQIDKLDENTIGRK